MALKPGDSLGHYQIRERIGAGGMGEVYRATDTTLRRDVAIKLLPEAFARDAERVARFKREAQLLAALNHPNIATIHGLFSDQSSGGQQYFLVMELVAGQTLAEMIQQCREQCRDRQGAGVGFGKFSGKDQKQPPLADARGTVTRNPDTQGLPLDETLSITTQICEALEHAHERGVIHRDLKPANVKVTPEGKVKVLDFGLAKAFAADGASSEVPPNHGIPYDSQAATVAPSLTASPTIPGVILGTAAYMSPEQARGKPVDKRTDIWALGCLLYEMLTGRPTFKGEDVTDILANVLKTEPDWTALSASIPLGIRSILRRCLHKDRKERLADAGDVRISIQEAVASPGSSGVSVPVVAALPLRSRTLPWVLGFASGALVIGIMWWALHPQPSPKVVTRLAVPLVDNEQLADRQQATGTILAISPDGSLLAYLASPRVGAPPQLYIRNMSTMESRPISATEGAYGPFFSPDGQWLAFFADGSLKKVSINGGAPMKLCEAQNARGGSWGTDGNIIFGTQVEGLLLVSGSGGTPEVLTKLGETESSHRLPDVLPASNAVLFTIGPAGGINYGNSVVAVLNRTTGKQEVLIRGGADARYVPTGHIVYWQVGTLMAVPFDVAKLKVLGPPAPIVEKVIMAGNGRGVQFSFARNGTFVYVPGTDAGQSGLMTLVKVGRDGKESPLLMTPQPYDDPAIAPNGQQLVLQITADSGWDLWIYDLLRATLSRLTFGEQANRPVWMPDGKRIVYSSEKPGAFGLYWKPADGSGAAEWLFKSATVVQPSSVSPDGAAVMYDMFAPTTGDDIWILPLQGDRKPNNFLQTTAATRGAMFSPDGGWLAYASTESGRPEVYVQPYPGPGGKWMISAEGGDAPAWSPDGRELFYRNGSRMMVAPVSTKPSFSAGTPRVLFENSSYYQGPGPADYAVTADGKNFLMLKVVEADDPATDAGQINVVLNWFEELKQKVPVK